LAQTFIATILSEMLPLHPSEKRR